MTAIIWWIRQLFCSHSFKYEEQKFRRYQPEYQFYETVYIVSRTCAKCGWHKSYDKF